MTIEAEKRNNSRMRERIAAISSTTPAPNRRIPREQFVISDPESAITWLESRGNGGLFIGQARNRILLNRAELNRLIEKARQLDPRVPAYSTTTPAKRQAQLMRYPITPRQERPAESDNSV
jgi:hypothetical protein